jgi:hypothetical protein
VTLTKIGTFIRPVEATAPPGDEHRLFVVEQTGIIRVGNGTVGVRKGRTPEPALLIATSVSRRP